MIFPQIFPKLKFSNPFAFLERVVEKVPRLWIQTEDLDSDLSILSY